MDRNENKIKKISYDIDENIKYLEGLFENCGDIVKRKFRSDGWLHRNWKIY